MRISDAVRELRSRRGESQQIFATNLHISIRSLVNYEMQKGARTPPLDVILRLQAVAREAGYNDLVKVFAEFFREQLTRSMKGQRIGFLSSGRRDEKLGGLLLLSFDSGEYQAVADFFNAFTAAFVSDDGRERARGKAILAALRDTRSAEAKK